MTPPPLHGLVLAGGFSRRMGRDKALLDFHGLPQAQWTARLLSPFCREVCISCRDDQSFEGIDADEYPRVLDTVDGKGPLAGILSAAHRNPDAAWLVVACDLPLLTPDVLSTLIENRASDKWATAFQSANDGLPEPLCAIYEPTIFPMFEAALAEDRRCPRKLLIQNEAKIRLLELPEPRALDNFNTPEDLKTFPSRKDSP